MTKREILNEIITNHNRLATMNVSGDNTIKMAETLVSLRNLVAKLQEDVKQEGE